MMVRRLTHQLAFLSPSGELGLVMVLTLFEFVLDSAGSICWYGLNCGLCHSNLLLYSFQRACL